MYDSVNNTQQMQYTTMSFIVQLDIGACHAVGCKRIARCATEATVSYCATEATVSYLIMQLSANHLLLQVDYKVNTS